MINGNRFLENGLVLPAIHVVRSNNKTVLSIILEQLKKTINVCKHEY